MDNSEKESSISYSLSKKMANLETLTPSWRAIASNRVASGKGEAQATRLNTPSSQTSSKKQVA